MLLVLDLPPASISSEIEIASLACWRSVSLISLAQTKNTALAESDQEAFERDRVGSLSQGRDGGMVLEKSKFQVALLT
jgi:hypothetical protein